MSRNTIKFINKKEVQEEKLPFLYTRYVKTLAKKDFNQYIATKDTAALVMFYDPDCIYCQSAKPHFIKAAKTTPFKNRVYAGVDCTQDEQLCEMENIKVFPTFKLYVGGRFLAKYSQTPNFENFRNFIENAPLDTHVDNTHRDQKPDILYLSGGSLAKSQKKVVEDAQHP